MEEKGSDDGTLVDYLLFRLFLFLFFFQAHWVAKRLACILGDCNSQRQWTHALLPRPPCLLLVRRLRRCEAVCCLTGQKLGGEI